MSRGSAGAYDAIIIGAGISGLVCGCYLAKAGMKVLIAEQHSKPGGYCTSFKRKGFTFDAAAHSLGGFRYGNIGKIFADLGIEKKIRLTKCNPSNIILTPDHRISFYDDIDKTAEELNAAFPEERNSIAKFLSFVITPDARTSAGMKSTTFREVLDGYFKDHRLKAILSYPLFGNSGSPPSLLAAFIGLKIFREFLLDGGYYPEGGMQTLADALSETFREHGGDMRLSSRVKKILVANDVIAGVVLEGSEYLSATYVISNCDARQTFLRLLGTKTVGREFSDDMQRMVPSLSAFILYLGMEKTYRSLHQPGSNLWVLSRYDLDSLYRDAKRAHFESFGGYLVHLSPDQRTVLAFMSAPFRSRTYWSTCKQKVSDAFTDKIEADVMPGLSAHLRYREAATPYTLHRYTGNYKGAAFGWASIPSQFAITDFRKPSFVKNLYLTGHWTTKGLGIPGVVYIGQDTASMVLRKEGLPRTRIVL